MAYGNWDDILKVYREVYLGSRFDEHAKSMLDLVPRIRDLFPDVIPMTSLSTLCLNLPSFSKHVCIWGQAIGSYEVYIYDPGNDPRKDGTVSECSIATSDEIIAAIEHCLSVIQEKAS